jgi:hypothetical protein
LQRWLKQRQPPHVERVDPVLEQTAENSKHLSADEVALDALEGQQPPDQITAAEQGPPADWITAEQNVRKRLSPFHGKCPKVVEFDTGRRARPCVGRSRGAKAGPPRGLTPSPAHGRAEPGTVGHDRPGAGQGRGSLELGRNARGCRRHEYQRRR